MKSAQFYPLEFEFQSCFAHEGRLWEAPAKTGSVGQRLGQRSLSPWRSWCYFSLGKQFRRQDFQKYLGCARNVRPCLSAKALSFAWCRAAEGVSSIVNLRNWSQWSLPSCWYLDRSLVLLRWSPLKGRYLKVFGNKIKVIIIVHKKKHLFIN